MASGGYQVSIQDLVNGAKAYHAHGSDVQQMLSQWQKLANLDSSVFGRLAVSAQMASGYEKFFSQVTKDVTRLYQALQNGSGSLARSAATYWVTEQLLAAYLRFLSEVKQDNKYLDLTDSGKEP